MPLLTKEILPKNTYKVRVGQNRVSKKFDEAYLTRIASQSNKMIAAGLVIPAPFDHHKDALPKTKQEIEVNKAASSYNNAGDWKAFWVAPNSKGVPTLYGQVDAPGSDSDKDSPYYKLKNVCKEVSISLADNFEDGLSRTWTDGLLHVAVVNHAIVPDQSPFQDSVSIVNMSMADPEEGDDKSSEPGSSAEGLIGELKTALQSKLNISLPGDTSPKTFMRDLLTAVLNTANQPNKDIEPVPVYMSTGDSNDMPLSQQQAEALVATKAVNPATNQPFTMEDFGYKKAPVSQPPTDMSGLTNKVAELERENAGLKQVASLLKKQFETRIIDGLKNRLEKLQTAGVVSKEFVDKMLAPQLTAYNMSALPDGSIAPHPLEITLSALETALPKTTNRGGFPEGADILPFDDGSGDLSDKDADEAINDLLGSL